MVSGMKKSQRDEKRAVVSKKYQRIIYLNVSMPKHIRMVHGKYAKSYLQQ